MDLRSKLNEEFSRWIALVEAAILVIYEALRPARLLRLVERPDGAFVAQTASAAEGSGLPDEPIRIIDGSVDTEDAAKWAAIFRRARVELVLQPHRFMFRPLELPSRASDFLEGIIRVQIDRLTPWSAAEAAFGSGPPSPIDDERMVVTIAATARSLIAPFANAFSKLGVDSVVILAPAPGADPDAAPIRVLETRVGGSGGQNRLRRSLATTLAGAGALASAAAAAALVLGGELESRRDDLSQRLTERRMALRSAHDASGEAAHVLAQRKRETPASVIVVDALSQILPDHTYLTELHIQADKLQIVGLSQDAPSLVRIIEQSPHFAKAVFFAPTTRSLSDPREHFSIEAEIKPVYEASR